MNRIQKLINYYNWGGRFLNDPFHKKSEELNLKEISKLPLRYDIINYIIEKYDFQNYLEIGVRNPNDNFNKINAKLKYSVDPGLEFDENPVDFKMTSDDFFDNLRNGKIFEEKIKFDVIFIDGLHLAEQVERDIENSLEFINDNGFIVLHDCNPPTEWHARDTYDYSISPAKTAWNGTTWKAFLKTRYRTDIFSCCIDTDWGCGIITKVLKEVKVPETKNDFFEFYVLDKFRKDQLNLITFDDFKKILFEK